MTITSFTLKTSESNRHVAFKMFNVLCDASHTKNKMMKTCVYGSKNQGKSDFKCIFNIYIAHHNFKVLIQISIISSSKEAYLQCVASLLALHCLWTEVPSSYSFGCM